jgi:hypothetical protein
MKTIAPRQITASEGAVIRGALAQASLGPVPGGMLDEVASLTVVAECECGCHSLYFQNPAAGDYRVADAVGFLPSGQRVELLVWAASGRVSALEVVDHLGAGELPEPQSVCSWEEAGKREAKNQAG